MLRSLVTRLSSTTKVDPSATTPRPDGFLTAKQSSALFAPTNPEDDGEECLHDCETCTISYPRKFEIDEDDKLYGEIQGWSRHLIVATGKTDWVRDVADEKDSVMEAVAKHTEAVQGGKLMLSASNIPVPEIVDEKEQHIGPYGKERPTTVLLMPAFTFVDNVRPIHVPELITSVINTATTNTTRLAPQITPTQSLDALPANLSTRPCPHRAVILLCSQATRDARCGQSAPLLRRELERHLRPLGLYRDLHDERPGGVGIYFISHVGGHKYSANMMVYRRGDEPDQGSEGSVETGKAPGEAMQCIWLARIRPEDCENVVRYTVLQGKVVKPERQLRGGFDRGRAIVSW
ncbi:unnamed protein product [Zymoseptoria tritici ST99CH_3D7]|uniref:Uncharacterized protein n=2 Tax=Zymoseptoria tritici TaxID=1047171 RepID=A0A1X7RMI8_ZYMT9|nr:unnamed protein product [Zymoseptoria tritici ST99CH_3D7]